MKIYNLIEVNELDIYDNASVDVTPFASYDSAKAEMLRRIADTKQRWNLTEDSGEWTIGEEERSFDFSNDDSEHYSIYIKEQEVQKYLVVLDFSKEQVAIVQLSDKEMKDSDKFTCFDDYFGNVLAEKYGFDYENSNWMLTENPNIKHYGTEKENQVSGGI